jgi:hypothetical protein
MWAYAVACLSGLLFAIILSLLVEKRGPHPGQDYTWYSIMKRPLPSS